MNGNSGTELQWHEIKSAFCLAGSNFYTHTYQGCIVCSGKLMILFLGFITTSFSSWFPEVSRGSRLKGTFSTAQCISQTSALYFWKSSSFASNFAPLVIPPSCGIQNLLSCSGFFFSFKKWVHLSSPQCPCSKLNSPSFCLKKLSFNNEKIFFIEV